MQLSRAINQECILYLAKKKTLKTEFTADKKVSLQWGIFFAFISVGSLCSYAVKGQDNDNGMGLYPLLMFPATAFSYLQHL